MTTTADSAVSLSISTPTNFDAEILDCRKFMFDRAGWGIRMMRRMLRGELKTLEQMREEQMAKVRYFENLGVIFEPQWPDDN